MTREEFDTLRKGWEIWETLRDSIDKFHSARGHAGVRWEASVDFLYSVTATGLVAATINVPNEDEWETNNSSFTIEELLSLDIETAKYEAIAEVLKETREKSYEEAELERKRKLYESLKSEFEGV